MQFSFNVFGERQIRIEEVVRLNIVLQKLRPRTHSFAILRDWLSKNLIVASLVIPGLWRPCQRRILVVEDGFDTLLLRHAGSGQA